MNLLVRQGYRRCSDRSCGDAVEIQSTRLTIAEEGFSRLDNFAHVTVRLSLERLARQAREKGRTYKWVLNGWKA